MNRRQFEQGCRDIAKRLGFRPTVQPYAGQLFEYRDPVLYIAARGDKPYLIVRAQDIKLKRPIVETRNGRVCFSSRWKNFADHVAKLTVLDQLAQL